MDAEVPFEHELGQGISHRITLDGFQIHRGWHQVDRKVVLHSEPDPASVELHFSLKGGVAAHVQGIKEAIRVRPGTHVIWYAPEPRLHFALTPGVRYERFEVNLTMDYFASLAERYPEMLEAVFSHIERSRPFCLHPGTSGLATTPQMKSVIRHILHGHEQGPLRRMFIEAKVTELLALQLAQHEERAVLPEEAAARLPDRDVDQMHEAHDRLLARVNDPPSLPELAHAVSTNEFKLKRDFKTVYGNTVYGLLFDHKMAHARALLLDTDRLVGDIAREVGYNHAAHFSTAFKKVHGVSPSSFRSVR